MQLLVANQQIIVPAVSLPGYVRHIADDRDCADEAFNCQIQDHAEQSNPGNPPLPRGEHDKDRGKGGERIADAGYPPDDRIETEADLGSGNDKTIVEPRALRQEWLSTILLKL